MTTPSSGHLLDEPHHDGSALYVSCDRVALGALVPVRVHVPSAFAADEVHVRTVVDGEPSWVEASIESSDEAGAWWSANVPVPNRVLPYRFLFLGGRAGYRWLNSVGFHPHDVPDRDDFRLTTFTPPPAWLADTVVYQIMPDRFARGPHAGARAVPPWAIASAWDEPIAPAWQDAVRQLFGGDLDGIVEHLAHVTDLGATALYLTPVFPAASSHRYDASTFDHVDPLLGGDESFAALTTAAHDHGIRVIGDLTTNHSGSEHEWFTSAVADDASTEAGFYLRDEQQGDFVRWFGVPTLPKFDLESPELRRRLVAGEGSVVARWLKPPYSLDGWRIDVANMTGRHGATDVNHEVARDARETMAALGANGWLVAEHCHDATADLTGDGWHGTMAYNWFTRPVWCWLCGEAGSPRLLGFPGTVPRLGGEDVVAAMRELSGGIPWVSFTASMTLLDSHDTARFRSVTGDVGLQIVGMALLLTYPGVPTVFAGDEVGVEGCDGDQARRPFPWDAVSWDTTVLDAYRALIALRRRSPALTRGGLRWANVSTDAITFLRESSEETVVVHLARAAHEQARLPSCVLGALDSAQPAFGTDPLRRDGEWVALPSAGPGAHIWRIPMHTRARGAVR